MGAAARPRRSEAKVEAVPRRRHRHHEAEGTGEALEVLDRALRRLAVGEQQAGRPFQGVEELLAIGGGGARPGRV